MTKLKASTVEDISDKFPALSKWFKKETPDVSHLPLLDPTVLPPTVLLQTLAKALTMRRDHESATEAEFVGWLANRLPITMIDTAGNLHVDLRRDERDRTMFTSHTDSVHHGGGVNKVRVDGKYWRADGAALGADDGAGVALMAHMIERGVPGYYIFFRGEERGGVGSSWLAENMEWLLKEFGHAVAFDRAGQSDVITYQSGGRCCSDKFAEALSQALCDTGLLYMPCDGGVYTDTAEFIDTIPECTNLSVGYKHQHGDCEEQDVEFLVQLAEALVQIDWNALPVERDPNARDFASSRYGGYSSYRPSGYAGRSAFDEAEDEEEELDGDELELSNALTLALNHDDFSQLRALIGAYLHPMDPDNGARHIIQKNLTLVVLREGISSLSFGWAAECVLEDLADICTAI